MPVIGFRIGKLDETYFSFQFPRNMSLNFPMGKKCYGSIFIKPMGGLYNILNNDSLYKGRDSIIQFGRYEFLNGFRLDYTGGKHFAFFISMGITTNNHIAFASYSYGKNKKGQVAPFYHQKFQANTFLNFGLSYRFGKAKKVYNNMNMYDVFDLNGTFDAGDNNSGPAGRDIPKKGDLKDMKAIQYKDIQDLIRLDDMY